MAETLLWPDVGHAQEQVASRAAALLRRGGLVVYPTDTVYGLGADPEHQAAIERIYQVKGRPDAKAIIWLVASIDDVRDACQIDAAAERLAARYWPGPLTLVLNRRDPPPGELPTLAVRVPAHPAALAIIRAVGGPVATTSANRSGEPSARDAAQASAALGTAVDLIIDAGPSPIGQESTVLDLTTSPPRVLRPGALSTANIEETLGTVIEGAPG
jgi:L-threonylcarbamoyladenylate synthase